MIPAIVYLVSGLTLAHGSAVFSIGTVVAFTTMLNRLVAPATALQGIGTAASTSMALFGRIFDVLDLPVDIKEKPDARSLPAPQGAVRVSEVSFRYGDDGPWTLAEIDFEVPAGTTTALVGETGSGKTTLAYLVARLYDPQLGRVTIDGVDLRDLKHSAISDAVGLVSQETYLFHESVRENLRFAAPGATDAEVVAAARAARIHELIVGLPDGYDTVVGARGYRFSGGERQRLAIARMLLRNPPILILDEATSALDNETERAVQAAIDELARGRTTIAIAHRLSTVRNADQILVLDQGRIVERGTHDELLDAAADNGEFSLAVEGEQCAVVQQTYFTREDRHVADRIVFLPKRKTAQRRETLVNDDVELRFFRHVQPKRLGGVVFLLSRDRFEFHRYGMS